MTRQVSSSSSRTMTCNDCTLFGVFTQRRPILSPGSKRAESSPSPVVACAERKPSSTTPVTSVSKHVATKDAEVPARVPIPRSTLSKACGRQGIENSFHIWGRPHSTQNIHRKKLVMEYHTAQAIRICATLRADSRSYSGTRPKSCPYSTE